MMTFAGHDAGPRGTAIENDFLSTLSDACRHFWKDYGLAGTNLPLRKCARSNCLTLGLHSRALIWKIEAEMNLVSVLQSEKQLVDVRGFEPLTPCLQSSRLVSTHSFYNFNY